MPHVKVNGIDFYYEIAGRGTPVFLLNGVFSNAQSWKTVVELLKNDFQLITYDCRDQGQTEVPKEDYDFHQHVEDLKGLMEVLNIKKAHVAGISHGSLVAMHFAAYYPENIMKLVLISPTSERSALDAHIRFFSEKILHDYGIKEFFYMLMTYAIGETYFEKIGQKIESLAESFEKFYQGKPSIYRIFNAAKQHYPFTQELSKIFVPTLIIAGEEDRYTPVSRSRIIHRNIAGSQLEIIEKCGHTINMEQPEELSRRLLNFLKG